jgi:nicotinamidase-related amidase
MAEDGTTAIIIVDFQKEWGLEDSIYHLGRISLAAKKCRTLVHEALKRNQPVFYTKRYMEMFEGEEFSPYEDRSDLHDQLPDDDRVDVIERDQWNPFYNTQLEQRLDSHNVDHVVIGGLPINGGVRTTAEMAFDMGFDVTIVEDCTTAKTSDTYDFTVQDITQYRSIWLDILKDYDEFL